VPAELLVPYCLMGGRILYFILLHPLSLTYFLRGGPLALNSRGYLPLFCFFRQAGLLDCKTRASNRFISSSVQLLVFPPGAKGYGEGGVVSRSPFRDPSFPGLVGRFNPILRLPSFSFAYYRSVLGRNHAQVPVACDYLSLVGGEEERPSLALSACSFYQNCLSAPSLLPLPFFPLSLSVEDREEGISLHFTHSLGSA